MAYPLLLIPYISLTYDVIGKASRAAELRVEYIIVREWFLNIGRIASILFFIGIISIFPEEQSIPYVLLIVGSGHLWIYFFVKRIQPPDGHSEVMPNVNESEGRVVLIKLCKISTSFDRILVLFYNNKCITCRVRKLFYALNLEC